jgi:hypothetical protein
MAKKIVAKNRKRFSLLVPMVGLLLLSGCTVIVADPYPSQANIPYPSQADIPPGHLPPPGECRIWYPDRPPGQQPPPGDCRVLRSRVPPGAELIYGR